MDEISNTSPDKNSEDGFTPSDLPKLPPEQLKLLRYIMRHSGITASQLVIDMQRLPPEDAVNLDHMEDMLAELVAAGHILCDVEAASYRAQIRLKERSRTMDGIWHALDADPESGLSPETAINPELRKVRSELTNRILVNLDQYQPVTSPPPRDSQTHLAANTLLGDLISTGKSSMEKRMAQSAAAKAQAEAASRKGGVGAAIDDLLGNLPQESQRVEPARPKPDLVVEVGAAPDASQGVLSKLLRLLGL